MTNPPKLKRPSEYTISEKEWRAVCALEKEPLIAAQIGIFVGQFGGIEISLPPLLSEMTGLPGSACEHMLGIHTSFARRLDTIEVASKAITHGSEREKFYDEVISEIKYLNSRRDRYCHSQYTQTTKTDEIRMLSFRTDTKRKTEEEIITMRSIKADCARAERVNLALASLLTPRKHELLPLRGKRQ